MVIISTNNNSAFVTEKITSIHKKYNPETHRITKYLEICYDNGNIQTVICKNAKDRDGLFDKIVEAMKLTTYK